MSIRICLIHTYIERLTDRQVVKQTKICQDRHWFSCHVLSLGIRTRARTGEYHHTGSWQRNMRSLVTGGASMPYHFSVWPRVLERKQHMYLHIRRSLSVHTTTTLPPTSLPPSLSPLSLPPSLGLVPSLPLSLLLSVLFPPLLPVRQVGLYDCGIRRLIGW